MLNYWPKWSLQRTFTLWNSQEYWLQTHITAQSSHNFIHKELFLYASQYVVSRIFFKCTSASVSHMRFQHLQDVQFLNWFFINVVSKRELFRCTIARLNWTRPVIAILNTFSCCKQMMPFHASVTLYLSSVQDTAGKVPQMRSPCWHSNILI